MKHESLSKKACSTSATHFGDTRLRMCFSLPTSPHFVVRSNQSNSFRVAGARSCKPLKSIGISIPCALDRPPNPRWLSQCNIISLGVTSPRFGDRAIQPVGKISGARQGLGHPSRGRYTPTRVWRTPPTVEEGIYCNIINWLMSANRVQRSPARIGTRLAVAYFPGRLGRVPMNGYSFLQLGAVSKDREFLKVNRRFLGSTDTAPPASRINEERASEP